MEPIGSMSHHAAHYSLLLALTEADSPMLLWLIVGGIFALGPVLHSYIKVYEWFKGKSVDMTAFVTREEFQAMRASRDKQIADSIGQFNVTTKEMSRRLEAVFALVGDLQKDMPAIHRALGRLEGHDEVTPARRTR